MKQMLRKTQAFLIDYVLKLKRYTSPLDDSKISKKQYDEELKYMQDVDTMFTTIEDCLFESDNQEVELKRNQALNDDYRYVEMYNRIIAEGVKSIPEEDQLWLRDYLVENKTHWHDAKFQILRRED